MAQTAGAALMPAWNDCRRSFIGWGAYMGLIAVYCVLHTAIVESAPVDLADSAAWPLREWGMWLLLTPLLWAGFRRAQAKAGVSRSAAWRHGALCAAALCLALACRVGLDVLEGARAASSLVHFLPRHATALALVVLAWQLAGRREDRELVRTAISSEPEPDPAPAMSATLLVSQGRRERLVQLYEIDVVSAAGNYVDIRCGDEVYLLRSTLTQLERTLPPGQFVRVHRSHLVNLSSLQHMTRTPAGNGSVVVRGGHVVPMSKKYRSVLKASCAIPAIDA